MPFIVDEADAQEARELAAQQQQQVTSGEEPMEGVEEGQQPEQENAEGEGAEEELIVEADEEEPLNPGGQETLIHDENEIEENQAIQYAPGEGNRPIGLLSDENAEYLSFPRNYAGQRLNIPARVTYGALVKWEVRHLDRRFCRTDHLLFKVAKLLARKVTDAIGIAMRQYHQRNEVTVDQFLNEQFQDEMIRRDQGKFD